MVISTGLRERERAVRVRENELESIANNVSRERYNINSHMGWIYINYGDPDKKRTVITVSLHDNRITVNDLEIRHFKFAVELLESYGGHSKGFVIGSYLK